MLLYAHTADLAATAFTSRRHTTDRTWFKHLFRALADFLVDHYDPAFPARAAVRLCRGDRKPTAAPSRAWR